MRVLMVCMGNICRSPTAEAVFRKKLEQAGVTDVTVDSAGTYGGHEGSAPDRLSQVVAQQSGYNMRDLRSRKIVPEDLENNDLILVMDERNYRDTEKLLAGDGPERKAAFAEKTRLFLTFHPDTKYIEVPDPYMGEADGFHLVLNLIEQTTEHIVDGIENVRREFNGT